MSFGIPLRCSLAEPLDSLLGVLSDSMTGVIGGAEFILRLSVTLVGGLSVPFDCLVVVLRNTFSVFVRVAETCLGWRETLRGGQPEP